MGVSAGGCGSSASVILPSTPPLKKERPDIQLVAKKPVVLDSAKGISDRQLLSNSPRGTPYNKVGTIV